jgi:dinuclear metal center YbgI/SA1388 family protein
MDLSTFCARFDELLAVGDYADVDASANGLQVGPPDGTVEKAAFAVDGAVATFETAVERGADVLVVHHGISWGGIERVTGADYRRVAPLIENDLALYAAHLPLDGHPELGNAAGIADLLELTRREPFGEMGPVAVGQRGHLPEPTTPAALVDRLRPALDTGDGDVRLLDFGPEEIEHVAVLTGSGTDWLGEAAAVGADVLITGEGKQKVYHEAREAGINVVLGGHYATETFGVAALEDQAAEWGVETTFIDEPTGL